MGRGGDDDETAEDEDDHGRRSPRRSHSAGGIHERLYDMHAGNLARQEDARQQSYRAVTTGASSRDAMHQSSTLSGAMSPRREGATPFGSSSPRPHLWLGAAAAAGPTTDSAVPSSPRDSRCGSVLDGSDAAEQPGPGPGAYDLKVCAARALPRPLSLVTPGRMLPRARAATRVLPCSQRMLAPRVRARRIRAPRTRARTLLARRSLCDAHRLLLGAAQSTSSFKENVQKDPSKGAASAFKSGTRRLFSASGEVGQQRSHTPRPASHTPRPTPKAPLAVRMPHAQVLDSDKYPGSKYSDSPGVGTYTPKVLDSRGSSSIGAAAAAIARQAEKLKQLRRSSSSPAPKTAERCPLTPKEGDKVPGPGAYEPGRLAQDKARRVFSVTASPFRSGSRRSLPWGGSGTDAPSSTRSRVSDADDSGAAAPGPGNYQLPGAFEKAKKPVGRHPGGAWTKGAPRFAKEPPLEKLTPSAVHYTPNYNGLS